MSMRRLPMRSASTPKAMPPAAEKISVAEALTAYTINNAYAAFEEDRKGSITPGKLADMVILSDNPLTIDPMNINKIVVLETIKEGKTVWVRK